MNILFDSLELIYGSSEKPFFLTDQNGNVLWKNRRCGKTVIFTNGISGRSKTEQVNIDGEVFSAVARKIDNNGKAYYLWEANTLSDILALLGCTDTYAEVCYMLAQMKSDVAAAEDAAGGQVPFLSIKRNVEVLSELSGVIYRKASASETLYFAEEINKIANEANRIMSKIPVVFKVCRDDTADSDIAVNAGQKLLYTSVFSIMRAMVRSSDRKLFNLEISYENGFAVMSSAFSLKADTHKGMITDSFEMFCAKMYIDSIGGQLSFSFNDDCGQISLALPKAKTTAFSSPVFKADEKICEKLAGIFMTDAAEQ